MRKEGKAIAEGAKIGVLLALVVATVFLLASGTAGAERTITSCQEINATNDGGGLVKIGSEISATGDCIEINTSDVVIDGQGNTVTGEGSGIGIEANATSAGGGATNVTVKDVKVEDFDRGIQYDDNGPGAGGEITNVNVTGNTYGLFAEGGVSVNVTNSELVSNVVGAQAYFTGRFEGNDISNNIGNGLFLQDTAQVVDNEIKNNGGPGIRVSGNDTRIADNEIVNNEESGVHVDGADGVVVENNLVTDNNQGFARGGAGIAVETAFNVEITNNRVHRNGENGVRTRDTPELLVQDNRITENYGNRAGLWIEGGVTSVTVERNNVSNNDRIGMVINGVLTSESSLTVNDIEANDNRGEGVRIDVATTGPTVNEMEASEIETNNNGGIELSGIEANDNRGAGVRIDTARLAVNEIEASEVETNNNGGIELSDIEANDNRGEGVLSFQTATVSNVRADDNGVGGIVLLGPGSSADGVTAVGNDEFGVYVGGQSTAVENSEIRENGFGTGGDRTGITVFADDVAIRNTVTEGNDMDIRAGVGDTTLENVDLGSATVSGTATEVAINGTPVSVPADPSGVQSVGAYFEADGPGYFDATVEYGSVGDIDESTLALWKNDANGGSWTELGGTVGANEVSYNITSFSTFGIFGEATDCLDRRSVGRGQEDQECPKDREINRGGSREDLDRSTGRDSDTRRRDRGRRDRGR
jgi:parallel beta-helix repeat protein